MSVFNDALAISFSEFLYKSICCGYLFELPRLVCPQHVFIDKSTLTVH